MKTLKDFQGQRMNLKQMNQLVGGLAENTNSFKQTATSGGATSHDTDFTTTDENGTQTTVRTDYPDPVWP